MDFDENDIIIRWRQRHCSDSRRSFSSLTLTPRLHADDKQLIFFSQCHAPQSPRIYTLKVGTLRRRLRTSDNMRTRLRRQSDNFHHEGACSLL